MVIKRIVLQLGMVPVLEKSTVVVVVGDGRSGENLGNIGTKVNGGQLH